MRASVGNPFDSAAVVLTTYDCAAENAEDINRVEWNIVVFEGAVCLWHTFCATGSQKPTPARTS